GNSAEYAMLAATAAQTGAVRTPRSAQPASPAPAKAVRPGTMREAPMRVAPATTAAHRTLEDRVMELGRGFDGEVGIAVRDVRTGWTTNWNGDRYFPQQSVSKFWVALTAFQKADAGQLDLSAPVTVRRNDLTLFHQPIAARVGANGFNT